MLLMSHYLGWALLKSTLTSNPSGQLLFWAGQMVSVAGLGALGLVGWRPGVTVRCTSTGLELEQGRRTDTVPYDAVQDVDVVSVTRYHRHYRRYAATRVFVGAVGEEVLLVRTERGPVAIALTDAEDRAELRAHLETAGVSSSPDPVPQPSS